MVVEICYYRVVFFFCILLNFSIDIVCGCVWFDCCDVVYYIFVGNIDEVFCFLFDFIYWVYVVVIVVLFIYDDCYVDVDDVFFV